MISQKILKYDKKSIIERLKTKLESHYIDSNKLFQILKENKAYISGSYLLGIICGDNFGNNNIDIFVYNNNDSENEKLESQIYDCIYNSDTYPREKYHKFNKCKPYGYHHKGIKSKSWLRISPCELSNYYKATCCKNSLDTINVNYVDKEYCSDIVSYINTFSLDICSNYYNGEELYIKNLASILNKCSVFNINSINNIPKEEPNKKYDNFYFKDSDLELIVKYMNLDFNIKVKYSNETYDINTINNKYKSIKNKKVLLLINESKDETIIDLNNLIFRLNIDTEIILVYIYQNSNEYRDIEKLDLNKLTLPFLLKEIRFFNLNIDEDDENEIKPKIPFGCELYIDNDKITL